MTAIDTNNNEIIAIMLVEDEEAHAAMICRIFEEDSPNLVDSSCCKHQRGV